jgi:hypothetical protein
MRRGDNLAGLEGCLSMFGASTKETDRHVGGRRPDDPVLYVVDPFIHPPDPTDPLTREGGLKPEQMPKPGP